MLAQEEGHTYSCEFWYQKSGVPSWNQVELYPIIYTWVWFLVIIFIFELHADNYSRAMPTNIARTLSPNQLVCFIFSFVKFLLTYQQLYYY